MILVDLNQVMISNLMAQLGSRSNNDDISEDLIRHMVLNTIKSFNTRFGEEYGDIVICCDSRHYWRREIFPNYKWGRKQSRSGDTLDWDLIFSIFNKVRDELKENMPWKVMDIYGAEADDIIATLVKHNTSGKVLILSSDKDFIQLQKYDGVKQYAPILKKWVDGVDPLRYIKEHVLKGDRGDGVPNFLSPDDTFVNGIRQKPISKKKLDYWIDSDPKGFCNEYQYRNFQRNQRLVDFDYIPKEIEESILSEFDSVETAGRHKILNYFVKNKLNDLIGQIQEF
tara:strand:+ start:1006 stop:1854 length:849 start_codon:yes stop_codon:yes gene_type:complete